MFNKIGNFFVQLILKSPLHRLLDRSLVLITVTGRKTGKHYTTPVSYRLVDPEHLIIFSKPERQWWHNLRDGAPVDLVLRGRQRHGYGHTIEERASMVDTLAKFFALSPKNAALMAEERVLLRITLRP